MAGSWAASGNDANGRWPKACASSHQPLRAPRIAQVGRAEFLFSPRIHQGNIGNIQSHPPSLGHTLVGHRGIVPQQWNDLKMWVMIRKKPRR